MISPEPKIACGASKAGMNHLAEELSVIAGAAGVRVNVLAPGNFNFPGGRWEEILSGPKAEEMRAWIARDCPMQRLGAPADIGIPAAFFLSPVNSYLNGAILQIDGGETKSRQRRWAGFIVSKIRRDPCA